MKLGDQLREVIRRDPRTIYRLGTQTGVHETQLSRFMKGEGLRLDTIETLCEFFRLKLVERPLTEAEQRNKDFVDAITEQRD